MLKKSAAIATLSLVFVAFSASTAFAQDAQDSFQADIEIMATLLLTNQADLNFGLVSQPDTGSATVTVNPDGTVDDGGLAVSGTSVGTFQVSGDDSQNISVDTQITNNFGGDLTLDTILVQGGDGTGAATIDAANWTTDDTFDIGGQVTIQDTVAVGTYNATFDVTAAYQ